jgi:hypothetical protein
MDDERWYTVMLETRGDPPDEDRLEDLLEKLMAEGVEGVNVSGGTLEAPGPGATFSVRAFAPEMALKAAVNVFTQAVAAVGLDHAGVEWAEVMTEDYRDRSLEREPERFVGVAEVADLLGVSKQRVSQLEAVDGFPAPVARLASGPVWRVSNLQRFVEGWHRKPGRRPKEEARGEQ